MYQKAFISRLKEYGIHNREDFFAQAFCRNIGLVSKEEQDRLSRATVAISGLGGVGGAHLITLVRLGIGCFHISDLDVFEPVNINRQFGATIPNFGKAKVQAMREMALSINPYVKIKVFPEGINEDNIDQFLEGVGVVLDGLDFFALETRRLLFTKAWERGIAVITAGPMGFSSAMLVFSPSRGMNFDEYFAIEKGEPQHRKLLAFAMGLSPRPTHLKYLDLSKVDLNRKSGPSSAIACELCAGMAAMEALRILLGRPGLRPVPYYCQFDPYRHKFRTGTLRLGNRNPLQRVKLWAVAKLLEHKTRSSEPKFPPPPTAGPVPLTEDVLRYLIMAGTWAPSADNCQPWRFVWSGGTLWLERDPDRSGFFYDVHHESTLLTLGAVAENIRIAATHYGLETNIEFYPASATSTRVAKLNFEAAGVPEDPLFPFLKKRQTNRSVFLDTPLRPETISMLAGAIGDFPEAKLFLLEREDQKRTMRKIIHTADRILFEDKRLHEGLYRWLRLRKTECDKRDGMRTEVLGLNWFQVIGLKILANWPLVSFLNRFGMSRLAAANSIRLLRRTPVYGLITSTDRSPDGYFRCGMLWERFWLMACRLGLSLQPMMGPVFLLNHLFSNGAAHFKKDHRQKIQGFWAELQQLLPAGYSGVPMVFCRLGYAASGHPRTPRRCVEEVFYRETQIQP